MPYMQVYDIEIDLTYQVEIDDETAAKARTNPRFKCYDEPIPKLRLLPRSRYLRDKILANEGNEMTIIEKVARAMYSDYEGGIKLGCKDIMHECAKAAIEAMRDLVKCDSNGNKQDNDILNEYIDRALK